MQTIKRINNIYTLNQVVRDTLSAGISLNTQYKDGDILYPTEGYRTTVLSPLPVETFEESDKLFLLRISGSLQLSKDIFVANKNNLFFDKIRLLVQKYPNLILDMDNKSMLGFLKLMILSEKKELKIVTEETDDELNTVSDFIGVPYGHIDTAIDNVLKGRKVILRGWFTETKDFESPVATVIKTTEGSHNLFTTVGRKNKVRALALNMGYTCDGKTR